MKKLLIIGLLALVVVTGGMFAYSYTTATATIAVTAPTSDFASITAGAGPTMPAVFGKFVGTWPSGTLFTITPDPNYTGDLVIKVYIANAGQLIRYYDHCNMALELQDSTGTKVDDQQIFQILNLQNAEIEFYWANGTGTGPYKVEISGGSFRLHQWKMLTGGSTSPQVWCEVTQR